ncbi:putative 8-oxo-dGTP diphosphatase NUDT15 [Apostichopus japonicus]|uniref:Putative 8-oxo-dGTP diphosphatase NUDT15 n=1 Tax=Stichopus japonicus TaxID=307972 RepID=A0A2G8K2L8_STIJA|nr:putative 8-oxo-dGTP diphosphatase NUDT15 [Apostichopus japonicus]
MESSSSNTHAGLNKRPKLEDAEDKFPRPGVGVGVFVTSQSIPSAYYLGREKIVLDQDSMPCQVAILNLESWEECGRRETMEETGLKLKEVSFAHVNNAVNRPTKYHYVTIFMKGEVDSSYKEEPENTEPDKCEGWQWTKWEDIPSPEKLFWSLRFTLAEGFNLFKP